MKRVRQTGLLRWLLPLCVYFILVAVLLASYRSHEYDRVVFTKESEMALAIEQENDKLDIRINSVVSSLRVAADASSFWAMKHNHNQIKQVLKGIVESTEATDAIACNLSGVGYDYQGREVDISGEYYFKELTDEYSRNGLGMLLPLDPVKQRNDDVLVVAHVDYEKQKGGYFIVTLPIFPVTKQLLPDKYSCENISTITMDGVVLASTVEFGQGVNAGKPKGFWEMLPPGISKDTIKLNISQKNTLMSEIKGYGYIIMVPMREAGGCTVALITYEEMKAMTRNEMKLINTLIIKMLLLSILFFVLVFIASLLGDHVQKRLRERKLSQVERDPVTGLLTEYSAYREIQKYIEETGSGKGIMFLIGIEGDLLSDNSQRETIDEKRKEFARTLVGNFRSSDIVGRVGDDRFLVFLKGVVGEKDLRKQTDEMQMFLRDMEVVDRGVQVTPHAGAAIYPDHGKSAKELVGAAEKALERSKEIGGGRLSF